MTIRLTLCETWRNNNCWTVCACHCTQLTYTIRNRTVPKSFLHLLNNHSSFIGGESKNFYNAHYSRQTHQQSRWTATPSRLMVPISAIPTILSLDTLPDTTIPIYAGLGQAPNMLACIPGGLVAHPVAWLTTTTTTFTQQDIMKHSVYCCEIMGLFNIIIMHTVHTDTCWYRCNV